MFVGQVPKVFSHSCRYSLSLPYCIDVIANRHLLAVELTDPQTMHTIEPRIVRVRRMALHARSMIAVARQLPGFAAHDLLIGIFPEVTYANACEVNQRAVLGFER